MSALVYIEGDQGTVQVKIVRRVPGSFTKTEEWRSTTVRKGEKVGFGLQDGYHIEVREVESE